ncbi:unnamed protein product, partial [marine sediment metagenome]
MSEESRNPIDNEELKKDNVKNESEDQKPLVEKQEAQIGKPILIRAEA